jgi:polyisoprenyl-phosphate glycosyltransferase
MKFSAVIPCYNEEESIPHLLSALTPLLKNEFKDDWEIIFVNDGSKDRTFELICRHNIENPCIKGVSLSRNFGHQAAISCGLEHASGEIVGIMDCDLQDTPEVLIQLCRKIRDEYYDVCFAVRKKREASFLKRFCYKAFYKLMRSISEHPWPEDAGDFSVFNQRVHQTILSLPEKVRVLRGLRSWVGFKQASIAVKRPERAHGETKYSMLKLMSLALTSLAGFSYAPLRLASMLGFFMGAFSMFLGLLFLLNRWFPSFTILHYYIGAYPGITTIILYLSVVCSMLFFCLGIMGEYLVILLKEVKGRPVGIVSNLIGDFKKTSK